MTDGNPGWAGSIYIKGGEMTDIERPARTRDSSKQTFYFSDFSVISFELWILHSYYFHVEPTVLFFFSFFVALKRVCSLSPSCI